MLQLSTNDIAILFPKEDQFVLGMDLFKYIETLRVVFPRGASVPKQQENGTANSHQPKSSSSGNGVAKPQQTTSRKRPSSSLPFTLPVFEPDLEQAMKKMLFTIRKSMPNSFERHVKPWLDTAVRITSHQPWIYERS